MPSVNRSAELTTHHSLAEYFRQAVGNAIESRNVDADADTAFYIVNLLTSFSRTDRLYQRSREGVTLPTLAGLYGKAMEGQRIEQRNAALRRLGDVALFICGAFSDSLKGKPVDVDYYVAMGGCAYARLANDVRGTTNGEAFGPIFEELAEKFVAFVDVLGEVCEGSRLHNDRDLLRLYEKWLTTGSMRAAEQLRAAGIEPHPAASNVRH